MTGLEPATFCVTGRRSNQLSYTPNIKNTFQNKKQYRFLTLYFEFLQFFCLHNKNKMIHIICSVLTQTGLRV